MAPSRNYKNEVQILAEELAEVKYGMDYDQLPEEKQAEIYEQAIQAWRDQ